MIIVGLNANLRAFSPWSIYNGTCWTCQPRADFPLVFPSDFYSGSLLSYMMLSSPYTCPQFRIGMVHMAGAVSSRLAFRVAASRTAYSFSSSNNGLQQSKPIFARVLSRVFLDFPGSASFQYRLIRARQAQRMTPFSLL